MTSAGLHRLDDPIVAVATASGPGAVGIVRLSGRGLAPLAQALLGGQLPEPRLARYGPLRAADGAVLDQALALWFPAPHSYTGEDVLELQAHGGPVLLQLLVARCLELARETVAEAPAEAAEREQPPALAHRAFGQARLPRLRLAEPGEFTQRAFLNDKLDLAQAEAVADLIDAGTESAARSAGRSLSGEFSQAIHALAERLVKLRLLVEATLDFPEEDIDFLEQADARGQLAAARAALDTLRGKASQGRLLRDGLQVVLAGQPNVGKSSLLNALAGAELAIVTPIAGTTRDKVSGSIQIDGVPVHVTDTAGLRDATDDAIERIGIERSWAAIEAADAVLFLHDRTQRGNAAHEAADAAIAQSLAQRAPQHVLHLHNKLDLAPDADPVVSEGVHPAGAGQPAGEHLDISALTGAGLPALRRWLLASAGWSAAPDGIFTARQRHLDALACCADHLDAAAGQLMAKNPALELFAEELRMAHRALGEIVGEFSTEDLLGAIFSRFCIGK